jgi:predicted CXXCH cytochrome family protein
VTTVKRLAFLGVGSAIILGFGVMGAAPAFADNGPHVSTSSDMTVDRCAGCHRAHTAKDAYLLKASETTLCETCHNGTGANTDVVDGVAMTAQGGNTALRAGGFQYAILDGASGVKGASISAGTSAGTTSAHNIGETGTAWGGGASGTDGTAITLECGSCHDPHGNGNYRILRPVPADAAGLTLGGAVGITSITPAGYWINSEGRYRYYYDVVTTAPHGFKVDDSVTFYDTGTALDGATTSGMIGAGVSLWTGDPAQPNWHKKATITSTSFTIYSGTALNVSASTGRVAYALSNGIAEVTVPTPGTAKYWTWNLHGLVTGQTVTVKGTTGFDQTGVITVVDKTSFTMATSATTAWYGNAQIVGIPDVASAGSKIYTTGNYWQPDDHNYTGTTLTGTLSATNTAANKGPTAFISNISQWCAQCHTRLFAGNGAWENVTSDPKFTVMHRSQSGKEGSPNCVTCHVAHGTSANMLGKDKSGNYYDSDPTHRWSSNVGTEFALSNVAGANGGSGAGDSFLLRVNNRGTCNMCHGL